MYSETTRDIKVTVRPVYLEDQSSPAENHFVWAYHVRIENLGRRTVRLRSRHWRITDANGRLQEVRGPGVVGEQPELKPGEAFEYTSGTPLARRPVSWSAATGWKPSTAKHSTSPYRPSRSIRRASPSGSTEERPCRP